MYTITITHSNSNQQKQALWQSVNDQDNVQNLS